MRCCTACWPRISASTRKRPDPVTGIATLLRNARFHFANERDLQKGIAQLFDQQGLTYAREFVLSKRDRVDFLVTPDLLLPARVAVEVKLGGSLPRLFEQVQRYALHDLVSEIVLVVSRSKFLDIPPEVSDKPVQVVLQRGFL